jgi:N-acetylneuraminate synthase
MFTKSIVAREDMPAGTVLQEEHLTLKKPGTGIPAARLGEVIGRRLKRPVAANALLSEDELD